MEALIKLVEESLLRNRNANYMNLSSQDKEKMRNAINDEDNFIHTEQFIQKEIDKTINEVFSRISLEKQLHDDYEADRARQINLESNKDADLNNFLSNQY